ncbi:MAG: ACP S-malonyltransferase [Actinomycetota bacterium]
MIVGLFPGQGIPARTVLDALVSGDPLLEAASDVLGFNLRRKVEIAARRKGAMLPTSLAQPAIYTASLTAYRRAEQERPTLDFLAGHSLGEYAALVAGGAMSFEDGLRCVNVRAEAMMAASKSSAGGMAAVLGLELSAVEDIAERTGVQVANDNAPAQTVVAGSEKGLADAAAVVRARGGRSVLLEVSGPFHTVAMAPAESPLRRTLEGVSVQVPAVPVLSNVTARPHGAPDHIVELLVQQLSTRVRWRESLEWLWYQGVRDFDDMGPGRIVAGLAQRTFTELDSGTEVGARA